MIEPAYMAGFFCGKEHARRRIGSSRETEAAADAAIDAYDGAARVVLA